MVSKDKISEVMRELGRRGGLKRTPRKSAAIIKNLKKARSIQNKTKKAIDKAAL